MKHKQAKCIDPNCGGGCWDCTLSVCEVCGQYEGGLPTDCPGEPVSPTMGEAIYACKLDYRNGEWVEGVSAFMYIPGHRGENPPVLPEGWRGFEEAS